MITEFINTKVAVTGVAGLFSVPYKLFSFIKNKKINCLKVLITLKGGLKIVLPCGLLAIFVGIVFAAEPLQLLKERAKNHYWGIGTDQSYSKALQLYLQAARQGDPEAQYISGGMYFKGLGAKKDLPMAFKLLHEAAKSGRSSPESQQIIGQAFLLGSGVPKNYDKARHWYALAAENGNKEAQNELGFMYFTGNGVEQDAAKGADLFLQAAHNGLAIAQYNVGIMYYTGNGFQATDIEKAYAWLNLAAANGHQPAMAARNYLESIMAVKELAAAQNLTDELARKIAP